MKKKFILLISILLLITILTGCWGAQELNTLGIVSATGIDIEGDEIITTFEIIKLNPSLGSSRSDGSKNVRYIQTRGKTIFEALRNTTLVFDRRIYLSHNQVYILGEELAKKGLTPYFDFLQRDHECRETAYLLVSKGSKAYEIMGFSSGVEDLQGNYIRDMLKNNKFTSKSVPINITEYFKNYYDAGIQPVVGVIQKKEKKYEKNMEMKNKDKSILSVEGAAVFNREKLVGYLNGEETRGYNYVRNKVKDGIIEFPTPSIDISKNTLLKIGSNVNNISNLDIKEFTVVEIIKSITKNKVEIEDGKIILKINVKTKGMLGEEQSNIDVSKDEVIKTLEEACSKEIKKQIEKALLKAQKEYKIDIFGFGNLFYRKYPKDWKKIKDNWNDIFSEVEFRVDVKTDIIRTGITNIPSDSLKGE